MICLALGVIESDTVRPFGKDVDLAAVFTGEQFLIEERVKPGGGPRDENADERGTSWYPKDE